METMSPTPSYLRSTFKVCVLGAAGGIGQPLSLLLKESRPYFISHLSLYDVAPTAGVAADISHIDTPVQVSHHQGKDQLKEALKDSDIVISVAGVTIKLGQTRDDVFNINGKIIKELMEAVAEACPNAFIAVVSNPVNSLTPLAVKVLTDKGVTGVEKRVFGVCTLDVVRSTTFAAEQLGIRTDRVFVPVAGAHEGTTIIPATSKTLVDGAETALAFSSEAEQEEFVKKVQQAGIKVLEAKEGKGTATLSMAYAAARFVYSLLRAKAGFTNVVECTYVKSNVTEAPYFSNPVIIGKDGIQGNPGKEFIKSLTPYEKKLVAAAVEKIKGDVKRGEDCVECKK